MRKYTLRILTVEKGLFTPLVCTTFGGRSLTKRSEDYYHVINRHPYKSSLVSPSKCSSGSQRRTRQTISNNNSQFHLYPLIWSLMPCTSSACEMLVNFEIVHGLLGDKVALK